MNKQLLDLKAKENNKTDKCLSIALGIDPATYYRKKNEVSEFNRKELKILKEELNLSPQEFDSIFFDDLLA